MDDRVAVVVNTDSIGQKRDKMFQKFKELVCLHSSLSCETQENYDRDMTELSSHVKDWLVVAPHSSKFYFLQFIEIVDDSTKQLKKCSPQNVSKSFMNIGQYAKQLLDQPWKKEFRTIKTYGGFFQIHIGSHIIDAIKIFELMGYRHVHALAILVLEGDINQEAVLKVYFCCFVASCEMDIVQDISDKLAEMYGIYSTQDIMRCRKETIGNVEQSVEWIRRHCNPTSNPAESKYINFSYKQTDDHYFAKSGAFEGKLPGTISKYGTDGINPKGPPAATQLFTSTIKEDLKNDDFKYYKDPILEGFDVIPNITENYSDEDLYEPADLDEHMERSLSILNAENDSVVNIPPDTYPQGGAGEWDFVRVKLTEDFGNEYFEGERGDLTKMATYKNSYPREKNEVHIKSKPVQQITVNLTPSPEEDYLAVDCPALPISLNDGAIPPIPKVVTKIEDTEVAGQDSCLPNKGMVTKPLEHLTRSTSSKVYYSLPMKAQFSQTPTEIKGEYWQCQICTLTNEAVSLVCAACGKSREVVKTPSLTSGGLECPNCTLVNVRGAEKCEACDAILASSPTYI